jgi:hypothetical protein
MPMTPLLAVDSAAVSSTLGGPVEFDDPACPWLVRVWTASDGRRSYISRLEVATRATLPTVEVTAARLARLPTAQLLHVAGAHAHPGEVYWRMLATPKPAGQRSWDAGHWQRVADVAAWATETGRAGGARQAVADLWGVRPDPTAKRWLRAARAAARVPAGV